MKARRLMTREVQCILPETPLTRAWSLMKELGVRHLPVTRDGRLVGLLSDRDLLARGLIVREGTVPGFGTLTAGEVMSLNPIVCPQGTAVSRIAYLMVEHQIDSIPIVSVDNQVVGLVTSTDLMSLLLKEKTAVLPFTFRVSSAAAVA